MILHSYYRSSSAYRVRIALNLKDLDYRIHPVDLSTGEEKASGYRALNPQGLVPTLVDGDRVITQSTAILEYLEECYPDPPLLPEAPYPRAQARARLQLINAEIQPLTNLRTKHYLCEQRGWGEDDWLEWYRHWTHAGLEVLEPLLPINGVGPFSLGEAPSLVDCFLVPQLYNARRFACDLKAYPHLRAIDEVCGRHPAFHQAHPDRQPDRPDGP